MRYLAILLAILATQHISAQHIEVESVAPKADGQNACFIKFLGDDGSFSKGGINELVYFRIEPKN